MIFEFHPVQINSAPISVSYILVYKYLNFSLKSLFYTKVLPVCFDTPIQFLTY